MRPRGAGFQPAADFQSARPLSRAPRDGWEEAFAASLAVDDPLLLEVLYEQECQEFVTEP